MKQWVISPGPAATLIVVGDPVNPVPVLIQNADPLLTVYIGNDVGINPAAPITCAPLSAGSYVVASGSEHVFAITSPGQVVAVNTYRGMTGFFLPASLASIGGARIFVQSTQPVTSNLPPNSLWFDTSNNSMKVWTGTVWNLQQFSGSQLIVAASVLSAQIANQAITTAKIAANAVGTGQIANQAVGAAQVANGSLTTAQLAAAAGILGSQIAAATVTSGNIAANTIVAANIAANTITAAQLAAGIIYAGIVNGTTIQGGTFIAGGGGTGKVPIYLQDDGLGNGIVKFLSGLGGSQPLLEGANVGPGSYNQLLMNGGALTATPNRDFVGIELNSSSGGVSVSANGELIYTDDAGGFHEIAYWDWSGFNALAGGRVTGLQPGTGTSSTNAAQSDPWHSIGLPSSGGFTGNIRCKMVAENKMMFLDVQVRWTALTGTGYNCGNLPSAAYYPTVNRQLMMVAGDGPNTTTPTSITVPAGSGPLNIFTGASASGSGTANWYGGTYMVPLD